MIFSANRYISNGFVPDITHIVYVNPDSYANLGSREELNDVGRAISRLNKLLPKRQFILMGPGRWGSRGDLKLGVKVRYSDINNTAVLIEIARKKGEYTPDLSFGTHFFQDLVEAQIRYLPLYPDDGEVEFNEIFLNQGNNLLPVLVPEFKHLAHTINVIDVPAVSGGLVLRVLMNAELDEAVGILSEPSLAQDSGNIFAVSTSRLPDTSWRWRFRMAEEIAGRISRERFGVQAFYLIGSTKNATASPASDIDVLIHFSGSPSQRKELEAWLNGWSICLAHMNYLRTGYRSGELLDVHIITDQDIANGNSYAAKIGAVTDAAKELPIGVK
jgi:predicted nucleotidyltransferase